MNVKGYLGMAMGMAMMDTANEKSMYGDLESDEEHEIKGISNSKPKESQRFVIKGVVIYAMSYKSALKKAKKKRNK